MNQSVRVLIVVICFLLFGGVPLTAGEPVEVPVKGMVTMVDLGADKCIPCKMMAPQFEQAARQMEPQVRFAKLDTEGARATAARFGIRSIPTVMLFKGGREIARQPGAMGAADIVRWVQANS